MSCASNLTVWDQCKYESGADASLGSALDFAFLFVCSCLVFFMQVGFSMLEVRRWRWESGLSLPVRPAECRCAWPPLQVGCVQRKNINSIILKGIIDMCISAVGFWSTGFAVACGADGRRQPLTTEPASD